MPKNKSDDNKYYDLERNVLKYEENEKLLNDKISDLLKDLKNE